MNGPTDIAVDASGNLFIADSLNALVRRVDRATQSITIYAGITAGKASVSSSGDGGQATSAPLKYPVGIALDASGDLYIADKNGNVIREVSSSSGTITTVAGSGNWGFYGDNGPAASADFEGPTAVRVDAGGNLYIVDSGNNAVRLVNSATHLIRTIAGNGSSGYGGDGGNPLSATLNAPTGLALDLSGNALVSDTANNIVRQVSSAKQLSFPATVIGLASSPQLLTFLNSGDQPLSLSGLTISSGFVQQSTNGSDCSATSVLTPGATCQMAIAFVPANAGNVAGQLSIPGTLGAPLNISLSGAGTGTLGGQVALNPASVKFGNQNLNTTSATQTVALTNTTAGILAISNIWLTGPNSADYKISTTCTTTVAAGASCSLVISFTPSGVGSRMAAVVVNDNAANSPQALSLTGVGVGVPQLAVSSATLTFASQGLAAAPSVQTISLSNPGSAALSIGSISLGGSNPADFLEASNCSSVAPGAVCNVSVWFAPTAVGTRTASLSITSSPGSAQVITLSGTAIANSQGYKFAPVNANFETGSPSGWTVIGNATVGSTAHTGTYGLKEQSGTGTTITFQDVSGLVAGQSYRIAAWVMSSVANASNAELWVHDTAGQNIAGSFYSGSGWQQVSVVFTATSTSAVRIHLCDFAGANAVYWDDITISLSVGNGDFEKGSLSGWTAAGPSAISLQAHSGKYGIAEQAASGTTLVFQDIQGLIPGQSYTISAWVKSSNSTTNGAELWLHDTAGANITGALVYPGTGWQQVTALFKATGTGAVRIHLCDFAGPETLYWDDVTITPAVSNGDFESGSIAPWLVAGNASLSSASHTGSFSLAEQPSAGTTLAYQDVQGLTQGQSYVVSAWVKATSASNAVELWLHDTTGQNSAGAVSYPGTGWQRVNTVFTATNTGAVRIHLIAFSGTGSVNWDDVTISSQ